jgi:peptidoglycan/LPS O-acetylase OafA/YrhL
MKHYGGIDLLRIAAALAVMLYHYAFRGAANGGFTSFQLPDLIPVAQYGYLGVELFFVISGFVITMSSEGQTVFGFARARFLRIYPTFVIAMTITSLTACAVGGARFHVPFLGWLANLTPFAPIFGRPFVDGVYWSLALEIVFYAWVVLFISLGWFETRRLAIIAAWLCLSLAVNGLTSSKTLHQLFLTDFAALFATGMLYCEMKRHGPSAARYLLLAVAFIMSIEGVLDRAAYFRNELHATIEDGILVLAVVAINAVFITSLALPRLPRLGSLLAVLAAASYPLYLLHENIGFILLNLIGDRLPAPATALLVATGMIGVSAALASWVDPVARRLAAKWLDRWVPARRRLPALRLDTAQLRALNQGSISQRKAAAPVIAGSHEA